MNHLLSIARYTLQELLHSRIIWLIPGIFIITMLFSALFAHAMLGSTIKVLLDTALFSYQLMCYSFIALMVIPFFALREQRALFALFTTHGVQRATLIYGPFTAFFLVLFMTGISYYAASLYFFYWLTDCLLLHLAIGFFAIFIESILLTAIGILCALLLPQVLATLCTVSIYVIGYSNQEWYNLLCKQETPWWGYTALHYLLPNLAWLDIKAHVVYQLPFYPEPFLLAIAYALFYAATTLITAHITLNYQSLN